MAPAALIFDLDGTIWDSYPWYASILSRLSGRPERDLETALRSGKTVIEVASQIGVSRSSLFAESSGDSKALQLYPGVGRTLDDFRKRSLPLGVVSSLPSRLVEAGLDAFKLRDRFKAVIHAGNSRVAKPSSRPILQCLSWMEITPTRSVYYVGDRDVDRRAAQAAGVSFAWAAYGYGAEGIPNDARIDRFEELLSL